MTRAPTIETGRTILRAHGPDDFEAYAAMWVDPVVTRFVGGRARTREETWIRLLRYAGMWPLIGYGFWAIEDKASGRLIGEAGFHDLKRDLMPSIEDVPEAGWALISSTHGKGLATEVLDAIHEWAKGRPGFARTVCIINPDNGASLAVAKKLGYGEVTRTTYHGEPVILLER